VNDTDDRRILISHVADHYRRYPGEDVTFHTRVQVQERVPGFTLRVVLPEALVPGATVAPDNAVPRIEVTAATRCLVWEVEQTAGRAIYEYQVSARVGPTPRDVVLQSRAAVTTSLVDGGQYTAGEAVAIAVSAQGRYLMHLPALYQRDELMGRFLMLFESFWGPITSQIGHLPLYFDPTLTPPDFLPWLASWLGLVLDERWPEARRRRLIQSAASLYHKRGTLQGLQEYLDIFGEQVQIIEHRAGSFRLGPNDRLGPGLALGTSNVSHTFTVILRSPRTPSVDGQEGAERAEQRRRMVQAIIETEKPAHTGYVLRVEAVEPAKQTEG
jgi:phage tail-like protein